jgi:purine-binding chemotaxis protein CheW
VTERVLTPGELFDAGFAAAPLPPPPAHRDFLCIRIGGEPCAIPLADIASLHTELRVVALPTRAPELLGVAAIRATVVAIYDLGAALGMPGTGAPRWTAVVRGRQAGFAFAGFEGHARIPDRSIAAATQHGHVRGQFSLDGQPRAIVDLGSVLTALERRWHSATAKDR